MSQRLGIYAIKDRKVIQKGLYDEYYKRVMYVYNRIQSMNNITCTVPEGTYYLFANVKETGIDSMTMWEKILDEAHVLVLPGSGFGAAGDVFIRIACTVGIEVLEKAMDRIASMEIFK